MHPRHGLTAQTILPPGELSSANGPTVSECIIHPPIYTLHPASNQPSRSYHAPTLKRPYRMPIQGILSLCEAKKMGLTDFWKSSTDKRADEVRSGAVAPSRTERKRCWESRDAYFACLDRNNILDAIKDDKAAAKQCGGDSVAFETDCAAEWVSKAKRKKKREKRRKKGARNHHGTRELRWKSK